MTTLSSSAFGHRWTEPRILMRAGTGRGHSTSMAMECSTSARARNWRTGSSLNCLAGRSRMASLRCTRVEIGSVVTPRTCRSPLGLNTWPPDLDYAVFRGRKSRRCPRMGEPILKGTDLGTVFDRTRDGGSHGAVGSHRSVRSAFAIAIDPRQRSARRRADEPKGITAID